MSEAVNRPDLVQGSPQWLKWREGGVTASDVPAILGKSPYRTKRDVWFEKAGFGELEDESKAQLFQMGHEMEAEIRGLLLKQTGLEFIPTCFEKDIIFLASLDGFHYTGKRLEAKLVGSAVLKEAANHGVIPEHHRIQIQAQLFASDGDSSIWAARAPKIAEGVFIEIGRDEAMIEVIRQEGEAFWESIEKEDPPPLSERDYFFVAQEEQVEAFRTLEALRKQKDMIDGAYEKLEKELKAWAPHPKIKCGSITITESLRAGNIDYAKVPEIAALSQDYLDSYRKKATTFKTIRFKKG